MTDRNLPRKLTPIQRKLAGHPGVKAVYDYIADYIETHNYAPTQREISEGCTLTRGTVVRYLDRLEAWGLLTREVNRARSIALVDDNHRL